MTALPSEIEAKPKVNPLLREHTIYKIGGKRVPSVTTLLALLNLDSKYQRLMGWQLKTVRAGLDPNAVSKDAATIGTLVHAMAEAYLLGNEVDTQFFSEDQIRIAKVGFDAFLSWFAKEKLKPIQVERPLTHPRLRYGGTIDLWAKSPKDHVLLDLKSSTAIFWDHRIQVAAYSELARVRYKKKHRVIILHLDKQTGVPTPHEYPDLTREFKCFRICMEAYKLERELKGE